MTIVWLSWTNREIFVVFKTGTFGSAVRQADWAPVAVPSRPTRSRHGGLQGLPSLSLEAPHLLSPLLRRPRAPVVLRAFAQRYTGLPPPLTFSKLDVDGELHRDGKDG